MLKFNLQFFSEEVGGEGNESVSESSSVEGEGVASSQTESGTEIPEPSEEDKVEQSKAFAKRLEERTSKKLAEERQKWEEEVKQKFQNYDEYKTVAEYLREQGQFKDILSAKEAVELERLQLRAAESNMPVAALKRMEELEAKAKELEIFQQQQEQNKQYQEFRSKLDDFAKEKDLNPDDLHNFMYENQISNLEVAYKAMKFEDVANQREQIEKEAVKKYLESKKAPKVESSGTAGTQGSAPATSWAEARQRALERFRSINQ